MGLVNIKFDNICGWNNQVTILHQMSEALIRIRVELSSLVGRERFSIPEKIMVLVDTNKLTTIADVRYYLINEVMMMMMIMLIMVMIFSRITKTSTFFYNN